MADKSGIYLSEKKEKTKMKFNSRLCVRCGGSKTINHIPFTETEDMIAEGQSIPCPNCNGEGIEYIISPKVWQEYKELKQAMDGVGV